VVSIGFQVSFPPNERFSFSFFVSFSAVREGAFGADLIFFFLYQAKVLSHEACRLVFFFLSVPSIKGSRPHCSRLSTHKIES